MFAVALLYELCQVEVVGTGDKVNLLCKGSLKVKPKAILTKYIENCLSFALILISLVGFIKDQIPIAIV